MKPWDEAQELPNNPEHWAPDPSSLYVEAPDTGDSAAVAGRVTLQDKAIVQQAVQSGKFRFKTEAELVRTAVVMFLVQYVKPTLDETSPEAKQLARRASIIRAAALANEAASIATFVKHVRRTVNDMATTGLAERIPSLVARMVAVLRSEHDGEWAAAAERGIKELPRVMHVWAEVELLLDPRPGAET